MKRCVVILVWAMVCCSLPSVVFAGSGTVPSDSELVFKMLCTTLVIFMALPGIVLFYGGMVQKKNVLSVFARCIVMTALVSVLWLVFGYNFTFLPNASWLNAIVGHFFFIGVQRASFYPPSPATASNMIDMIYQMGFAIIAVVIIVGGFAERMRFSATMLFTPFWLLLCYCPIAHWVWGGGWLSQLGALDFAGGTVVHINAGVAGLVAALMVKQRQKMTYQPNSLVLVTIGTSIIWIGWFGFDAGSANSILYGLLALINTHVAAASAALGWLTIEWMHHRKPAARGLLFGAIAGLVAITPAAGYCSPVLAVVIGLYALRPQGHLIKNVG